MSHKKFGPDRFSRFDVYWIQTNRQTDRQAKFIYRCILCTINGNAAVVCGNSMERLNARQNKKIKSVNKNKKILKNKQIVNKESK